MRLNICPLIWKLNRRVKCIVRKVAVHRTRIKVYLSYVQFILEQITCRAAFVYGHQGVPQKKNDVSDLIIQ